jgi:hypothetical protein
MDDLSIDSNDDNEFKNTEYNEFIEKKYNTINLLKNSFSQNLNNIPTNLIKCDFLYKNLKIFSNYIKSVYYILLNLKINNLDFREDCSCCHTHTKINFKNCENEFIPLNIKIKIFMKNFMNIIDLLPCYCNSSQQKNTEINFYKADCFNFKDVFKLYLDNIPQLLQYLIEFFNLNISQKNKNFNEVLLLPENRCIHEDIRYNNKIINCLHKKNNTLNNSIEFINELQKINNVVLDLIPFILKLYSEQSIQMFKSIIHKQNILDYFKKIYVKQFPVINIHYKNENKTIMNLLIESDISFIILKNMFIYIIEEIKKTENETKYILSFISEALKINKFDFSIELFTLLHFNDDMENYKNKLIEIIEKILNSNINTEQKYVFIKNIYVKKIPYVNILNKIINDFSLISLFEDNIDFDKLNKNNYELLLNECIITENLTMCDYILKKYGNRIKNAYVNYFSSISKKENIDLLNIILKYNYDINVKINQNTFENGNICLLYYCIKKNLIDSGIFLIENGIELNNLYNEKSLLVLAIQAEQYMTSYLIIQKNNTIMNIFYENLTPTNILLLKPTEKFNYLHLLNAMILYNTNYTDNFNTHIGFLILNLNISRQYKIILFNTIKHLINPIIENKNPLIIDCILKNELELAYILNQNLNDSVIYKPLILHCLNNTNKSFTNNYIFDLFIIYEIFFYTIFYTLWFMFYSFSIKPKKNKYNYLNDFENDNYIHEIVDTIDTNESNTEHNIWIHSNKSMKKTETEEEEMEFSYFEDSISLNNISFSGKKSL